MENQNKPKNPNAFPIEYQDGEFQTGMTLRDYFAAKAMQGVLSNSSISVKIGKNFQKENENIAIACYSVADAMLKEREKATE